MKKVYLAIAVLASVTLFSCSNENYAGDYSPTDPDNGIEAISFGGGAPAMTRGYLYGGSAATKLGNKFVVYGTKHLTAAEDKTATNDAVVFNNFQVEYTASTAGTTASNSSDWEYVGKQAYDATPTSQGIKYWDQSAAQGYTFYAFSSTDISYPIATATDKVQVTKVTADAGETGSLYNKGYSVTVTPSATLNNLYFSDRVEVPKTNYGKTVSFTFRNIGAKVRFGFYETIPGYTVSIDKFYIDDANSAVVTDFAKMNDGQTDGFYASIQNVKTSANQTINVTYYGSTTATQVINRPKVSNPTGGYDYYLKLGSAATIITPTLSESSANPTWVLADDVTTPDHYAPVYPFEGNTNPLLLKLDFTLTSEDGNGDVIHVKGARAIVPAQYVQWKSNFAYTYIFKISDKTNGTTGDVDSNDDPITDPEGLLPITFDAIVVDVDEEKQETITSVSTNSITTYAEGALADEYTHGKSIYVVITDNSTADHSVITPTAIGTAATEAQVYSLSKAASEAEVLAKLNGSPITGLTLTATTAAIESTIPLADGTTPSIANVKFTPSAAGYYAYVYTRTAYVPTTYTAATGAYDSSITYYLKNASNVYYAVSVPNAAAYADNLANLYVVNTAGTTGVYDIKVIKVD